MIYRFGDFELDPRLGLLCGPEGPQPLRKQVCRLLEVLLEHAPELLDQNTLLDEAWGRTALSPNVVPQAISELRQALGDQAQAPRYIETLHRRGYRIICPVERIDAQQEPDSDSAGEPYPAQAPEFTVEPVNRLLLAGTLGLVAALALVLGLWWNQVSVHRWLEREALPEIRQLAGEDLARAWRRLREVRERAPRDERLEQLWLDIALPNRLLSEPPGAEVAVRGFREADADWIVLGRTPLEDVRLPLAQLRFRVMLDGYAPIESAPAILPLAAPFVLRPAEEARDGMVYVPAGSVTYLGQSRELPGFWIDRHELTNRQYREFVEAGGYRRSEFWRFPVQVDGRPLSFAELTAGLVDSTGLPGPSTWSMGTYPAGQGDHPVEGISWYEAAAFAEFAGKQLPTVFHWRRAAGLGIPQHQNFSDVLLVSNFNSSGTVPVGSLDSLGSHGTFGMSGNVGEWCFNADGDLRHFLGGFYREAGYRFADVEARHPLERGPGFGVRLMLQDEPLAAEVLAEVVAPDRTLPPPVDDDTFRLYARQFEYDRSPLNARVEETDDSHAHWRRERVSIDAAYGNERLILQVFIPHRSRPPYQGVINFPGGDALLLDSSRQAGLHHVEPFLHTGRAVVYPVYQGTFERKLPTRPGPMAQRQLLVNQVKDLRRAIDYLESRGDFDLKRLLYHGVSYGANRAPFPLAVEDRFAAAILLSGGLGVWTHLPPEIQPQHYLPRVTLPLLLINGRDDYNFPVETAQLPFFNLLGTPPERKKHMILDWGHLPPTYTEVIRAYLDWTDRWLGPVEG